MVKIMHWQTCKPKMLHLFRNGGSIWFDVYSSNHVVYYEEFENYLFVEVVILILFYCDGIMEREREQDDDGGNQTWW